jgi:hypothetical protein
VEARIEHLFFWDENMFREICYVQHYPKEKDIKEHLAAISNLSKEIGTPYGVLLSQKYTIKAIELGNLKGVDRILCGAFDPKNVHLLPTIVRFRREETNHIDEGTDISCFAFDRPEINYLLKRDSQLDRPRWMTGIPFIDVGEHRIMRDDSREGAERTGNESRPDIFDMFYFKVAMIFNGG